MNAPSKAEFLLIQYLSSCSGEAFARFRFGKVIVTVLMRLTSLYGKMAF